MNYRIYAKAPGERIYKALDLGEGAQVDKLIYASIVSDLAEARRIKQNLTEQNSDWDFQIRDVKGGIVND